MGFQPFVAGSGLVAWRNLQRTMPQQLEVFSQTSEQKRTTDHFLNVAPTLKSAQDIVDDRRSLSVALGAYGLQDDLNNTYFVRRILDEGTIEPESLANRMSDSRYGRLSGDLAMDGLTRFTGILPETAKMISAQYTENAFAIAVGESQPDLRLALNADQALARIGEMDVSDNAKWYLVMGDSPLRSVVETALGLPSSFGSLDLEQQLDVFRQQASKAFGVSEISDLASDEVRGDVIDRFLLKEQLSQGQSLSSYNIALQLISA